MTRANTVPVDNRPVPPSSAGRLGSQILQRGALPLPARTNGERCLLGAATSPAQVPLERPRACATKLEIVTRLPPAGLRPPGAICTSAGMCAADRDRKATP